MKKLIDSIIRQHKVKKILKDEFYNEIIKHIICEFQQAFENDEIILKRTVYTLRQHYSFTPELTEKDLVYIVHQIYSKM